MKPLYWKLLLILGAVIVGASLVVPKALRKNAAHDANIVAQTLNITGVSQNTYLDTSTTQTKNTIVIIGKFKNLLNTHNTKFPKLNFSIPSRLVAVGNDLPHSLNAGTRPTKSRVVY